MNNKGLFGNSMDLPDMYYLVLIVDKLFKANIHKYILFSRISKYEAIIFKLKIV